MNGVSHILWQKRVAGPLESKKGPEAPSDEKDLPKGSLDSTEEDSELLGQVTLSAWPGPLST